LEKEPDRRFQSAKDVRNELQDLHREESLSAAVPVTPEPKPEPPKKQMRWPLVAAAVAGAAIVLIALISLWLDRSQPPTEPPTESLAEPAAAVEAKPPMIVVLPFENLGDPEDEYFADGMTEEITSRLAVVSGLGVISRTSAMQYKEDRPSLKRVGEELGVDYVLEGTVRWEKPSDGPSRVRVTPQLIRVSDDVHLWSERYDQTLEEIFAVQSAVAEEVIARVGVELLTGERTAIDARPTDNPDAYEAYLRGFSHWRDRDYSETTLRMAAQMFERAIELDPDFVQAHALLSVIHSRIFWESYDRTEERLARARMAAERALELDPSSAYAHLAMGRYHYMGHREYELALEELRTAETLLPSDAQVHAFLGFVMRRQGRFEETVTEWKKAIVLDPRSVLVLGELGLVYEFLRRYEEAEHSYNRSISVAPDQELAYSELAMNYILWRGETDKARTVLEQMPKTEHPYSILRWVSLELYERNYREALRWLSFAPAEMPAGYWEQRVVVKALWEGLILQLMGEGEKAGSVYEAALPELERAVEEHPESPSDHSNLGWAYAGLGRKEEAIRGGRRAVELHPIAKDALTGPFYVEMLAQIAVMVGDYDLALDQLETLLSVPSYFSASLLRLDPRWDPLRDHPRFQALLEKYE
jgi:serine/threonine-protein kinase